MLCYAGNGRFALEAAAVQEYKQAFKGERKLFKKQYRATVKQAMRAGKFTSHLPLLVMSRPFLRECLFLQRLRSAASEKELRRRMSPTVSTHATRQLLVVPRPSLTDCS